VEKAEAPAPVAVEKVEVPAPSAEKCEAEKLVLEAEAAKEVAIAKGAERYARVDYDRASGVLSKAKEALSASAFSESMKEAREAARLFNAAGSVSARAQEAERSAWQTACDKALAEERERLAKEKEEALAEERKRCEERLLAKTPAPIAPAAPPEEFYDVRGGDCLWNIAKTAYGDPFQWPVIFKANRDKIHNPNLIYPKQRLKVPRDVTQDEIKRAIEEASKKSWPKK
jgi:nucleoid-associated protein YgaU